MVKLHVNVDHVATVRQARRERFPDPVEWALRAEHAGAEGITCHLRQDRRHIHEEDVRQLRGRIATRLNLELSLAPDIVVASQLYDWEDILLDMEDLDQFSDEQLNKVCFQRGINLQQSRAEMLKDLKLWLSISNKRNVPHSLLLVIRMIDYLHNNFEVDEDETEAEILRRSKSDAYYIESVRAFEKAFGLIELERIISET